MPLSFEPDLAEHLAYPYIKQDASSARKSDSENVDGGGLSEGGDGGGSGEGDEGGGREGVDESSAISKGQRYLSSSSAPVLTQFGRSTRRALPPCCLQQSC